MCPFIGKVLHLSPTKICLCTINSHSHYSNFHFHVTSHYFLKKHFKVLSVKLIKKAKIDVKSPISTRKQEGNKVFQRILKSFKGIHIRLKNVVKQWLPKRLYLFFHFLNKYFPILPYFFPTC